MFDRGLGQILHNELHWLDVPDRVIFKLAVLVHRCLNGRALPYLSDYCVPVASADTQRHLRPANRQLLAVPRCRLNTYALALSQARNHGYWAIHRALCLFTPQHLPTRRDGQAESAYK